MEVIRKESNWPFTKKVTREQEQICTFKKINKNFRGFGTFSDSIDPTC